MKYNQKHNIFGWLAVSTLLLTTACTSVADLDVAQVDKADGANVVTITVQPQSVTSGMRAAGDLKTGNKHISTGEKVDILYYTIYKENADREFIPVTDADGLAKGNTIGESFEGELGDGQTVVSFSEANNWSVKIRLAVASETRYKLAFWAQSKNAKDVFDAKDLRKVRVKYDNAKNNDELRDAFCAVSDIIDGSVSENKVTLRRPFAQINVGTTGADYKNIVIGSQVYPNKPVTQSKITLYGVANTLDVLNNTVDGLVEKVEFDYNIIPAFMEGKLPEITDNDYSLLYSTLNDYEFLKVDLDDDKKIAAYKINYPTLGPNDEYLTETFKYLSMCYALVPASTSTGGEPEGASAVLTKVEVSFAETDQDKKPVGGYTPLTLVNVPVHRNWRTNILGGLAWIKDPNPENPNDDDDPDNPDPDDPYIPGYPTPDPDDPDEPYIPDDPTDPTPDPDNPDNPTPDPVYPPDGPEDPSSVFGFTNLKVFIEPLLEDEKNNGYEFVDPDGGDEPESDSPETN